MINKAYNIIEYLQKKETLVHCITNPISINQCANTILSVGAKPMMAEHPKEVAEITQSADALMLNLGNITDARMEAMLISANKAKEKGIPIVLDAVGVACSILRRKYAFQLLLSVIPTVIKGNYSEINALYNEKYSSYGVDADESLSTKNITLTAEELARKYQSIILATGETDIITDGKRTVYVNNGCKQLSSVTGTGCMLGALCASFLTSDKGIDSVIASAVYFGICGELSITEKGIGTFMVNLLNNLSTLDNKTINEYMRVDEE